LTNLDLGINIPFVKENEYIRLLNKTKNTLGHLRSQRRRLQAQLQEVDRRIENVEKGMEGLARLADEEELAGLPIGVVQPLVKYKSFTDAIAYTLKTSPLSRFAPTQVRDRLMELGYDLSKYKSDPVASIHTILKRLVKSGRVRTERNEIGKLAYRWISEEEKLAGGVPNPFATTLVEMLTPTKKEE
jgi:hypothetical protein